MGELEDQRMNRFYSQAGQDEWISSLFEFKREGYFLDIGAHNGIDINNTYFLEKELGWSGICIEADPVIFSSLSSNRKCTCVNIAVSDQEGEISFLQDGFSGRESSSPGSIRIKTKSLKEILNDLNPPKVIDYLSLDIEGMELKALMGFPFDEYGILAITVEHNLYTGKEDYKREIKNFLEGKGYLIFRENIESQGSPFEDWYIDKSLKEKL